MQIYDQWQHLTEDERNFIIKRPYTAVILINSKKKAYAETTKRFGFNGRNDKSDAFRHSYWSAIMARDLGYSQAEEFTTAHESSPTNNPLEKKMDLHNNKIGLNIGRYGGSDDTLAEKCVQALKRGQLYVLSP